jgi:hypothetical protein
LNFNVFDIIEKVLFYYAILSKIQNHSSNRIWVRNVVVIESRDRDRSRFSRNRKFCIHHVSWDAVTSNRCIAVNHWERYLLEFTRESSQLHVQYSAHHRKFTAWEFDFYWHFEEFDLLNHQWFNSRAENDSANQRWD